MVSRLSIVMIIVNMILGVMIPVVIMVSFKKKYKVCIKSFLVGCVTMLLFAMVLEQLVHSVVLGSEIGTVILEQGRILVVDELDSSIHFKLTRAIVAMFNNELNTSAQMIFTVHDINLMDCKRMFRKEQIWFVHKDEEGVYVYSLADFTAQQGVRDTTDVMEKYRKGALGALPDPELINSLLNIKGDVKGDDADTK